MQGTVTREVTNKSSYRALRTLTLIILLLLAAQFLIGMLVNLYVTTIPPHPGVSAPEYFSGVAQAVVVRIETPADNLHGRADGAHSVERTNITSST